MININGKLIVLEGGDGSGKSSVWTALNKKYGEDKRFVFSREPGGTEYGEHVRNILLSSGHGDISPLAELFSFCTARANHCDLLIRPALQKGKIIILDRFDGSTIAYQIWGNERRHLEDIFNQVNNIAKGYGTEMVVPDLVIYFDVDPKIGKARTSERKDKGGENNRLDKKKESFHTRVRDGYLYQCQHNENWKIIDTSNKLLHEVISQAFEMIESVMN